MFTKELNELKLRHLTLRLRSIELRAEMREDLAGLSQPLGWWGLAGGAAGAQLLLRGRETGGWRGRVLGHVLNVARLGLRIAHLIRLLK